MLPEGVNVSLCIQYREEEGGKKKNNSGLVRGRESSLIS